MGRRENVQPPRRTGVCQRWPGRMVAKEEVPSGRSRANVSRGQLCKAEPVGEGVSLQRRLCPTAVRGRARGQRTWLFSARGRWPRKRRGCCTDVTRDAGLRARCRDWARLWVVSLEESVRGGHVGADTPCWFGERKGGRGRDYRICPSSRFFLLSA